MITYMAAAAEPERGWGGPIAILVASVGIWLIHLAVQAIERRRLPSPTERATRSRRVNPQVSDGSDTDDTAADTGWWGEIVEVGGHRMRQVRQVLTTGSSQLPDDERDQLVVDDIDLALDDEPATLEEWVIANLGRFGYAELVREGMRLWQVSESTMKRRIADAREPQ